MTGLIEPNTALRRRMLAGESLFGTFVKTPHAHVVEILSNSGFDFFVLDAEHAPFDRTSLDACILASLAWRKPALVRVPFAQPDWIMGALDCGAAGVMVPHVSSVEQATEIAKMVRYEGDGLRGFSPSPRAGEYGRRGLAGHLDQARHDILLICQIEDGAGAAAAREIGAVDGVDALFVGPADLAVSIGRRDMADPAVVDLCGQVLAHGGDQVRTGLYIAKAAEATRWQSAGASFFLVGSDHTLLKSGSQSCLQRMS
jgi:2-keto-3-deoxy-L-rhamnonate aldolase RhmA